MVEILEGERVSRPSLQESAPDNVSVLVVHAQPLVVLDKTIGLMGAVFLNAPSFIPEDEKFFTTLAVQVALFIENDRIKQTLVRQADELARSNKELEQFAYVASHDLQEPLRMVSSYCQLLARRYQGKLDKDADEFIVFAVDGAKRMQQLIQDLLIYSRVGTRGKEHAPTDCNAVIRRVLLNLKIAIEESGAVVTHDQMPTVMADEGQLGQLLQNLIGNAIKYRKKGIKPEIRVEGKAHKEGWLFSVRDNGIGIDPQHFNRLFIIFQRLQTREEYAGTGIGLAVCKKIVERHGGRIWIESKPEEGSTFYFTIPNQGDCS